MKNALPLLLCLLLASPSLAKERTPRAFMAGEDKAALKPVLEALRGAKQRVWLFAYTLSDKELIAALAQKAAQPGCDLRVVIDAKQYAKAKSKLGALRGKITAIKVPKKGRMHVKLLLIDDSTLLLGSKNWSHLESTSKWNDVVHLQDSALAGRAAAEFARWAKLKAKKPKPPKRGAASALYFSAPGKQGARARAHLLSLLQRARKRVLVGMFVLNDPELAAALRKVSQRKGAQVRVVLDAFQFANLRRRKDRAAKALLADLQALGAKLRLAKGKQVHHKFALIDETLVTGSANWTKAAWEKNHEAILILGELGKGAVRKALAKAYVARHAELWKQAQR